MASVGGRTSRSNPGPAAAVTDLGPATSSIGSTSAAVAAAPVEGRTEQTMVWTAGELESLRLCRNRAYHKVNTKRRQHLPASLSSFTLREWHAAHPKDKFSAKWLLGIYNKNYEQPGRNSKRVLGKKKRGLEEAGEARESPSEDAEASWLKQENEEDSRLVSMDDHVDKQWTDIMLETLVRCGERVEARQRGGEESRDFSTLLAEEWLACFPKSTLTSRNLKSRLTVYQKTRSEAPPPSKRKKYDDSGGGTGAVASSPKQTVVQRGTEDSEPVEKKSAIDKDDEEEMDSSATLSEGDRIGVLAKKEEDVQDQETDEQGSKDVESLQCDSHSDAATMNEEEEVGAEKQDNFTDAPALEAEEKDSDLAREKSPTPLPDALESALPAKKEVFEEEEEDASGDVDDTKLLDEVHDEFAPDANSNEVLDEVVAGGSGGHSSDWACEKHRMHMFRGEQDAGVDCRLTEELLQVRERLKGIFQGCDLYQVKKPRGFSVATLREWQRIYPNSDENIKSISVKFSKYDRKFERQSNDDVPTEGIRSRNTWTPAMISGLQKSRQMAECKAGENPTSHMLTRKWKEEWKRLFPSLDVDWKLVVSRYNYHFGNVDGLQDSSSRDINDGAEAEGKVKGFRNWTTRTKLDLLETHRKILLDRPDLEPGSSDYNKILLQEFQKLHPKCMESSRSIYSKVQSVEKEETLNGGPRMGGILSSPPTTRTRSRAWSDEEAPADDRNGGGDDVVSAESLLNGEGMDDLPKIKDEEEEEEESGANSTFASNAASSTEEASRKENGGSNLLTATTIEHKIEGFDQWNLTMIRDFIACMDSTRRKFATLKEKNPTGNVKLVPLLLEEWKKLYPDTQETVKTFLVKIKHLKQQKDMIKKSLCQAGLLPTADGKDAVPAEENTKKKSGRSGNGGSGSEGAEFKWHKSMINDVISSRKRALEIKEQGMKKGKKLSFHQLWSSEFKKIYPNSTFTSNNLSVHLWTWRKQQQRMGKGDPMYDEAYSLADTSRPLPASASSSSSSSAPSGSSSSSGSAHWNAKLKLQLLELGSKVQASLSDPETPNEQKVLGFSNMLHVEWCKLYPRRSDTARALNMMHCRILKEGVDQLLEHVPSSSSSRGDRKKSTWTPRYNRGLRKCIDLQNSLSPVCYSVYSLQVIEQWRKLFPEARESDFSLKNRIGDLICSRDDLAEEAAANSSSVSWLASLQHQHQQQQASSKRLTKVESKSVPARSDSNDSADKDKSEGPPTKAPTVEQDQNLYGITRAPNARGQMCWNKQTIRDLFLCHQVGLTLRQRSLVSMSKKDAPILSTLVHEEFLKLHPYCKLTPAILMAKLYCWKNAVNKGTLDLEMSPQDLAIAAAAEQKGKAVKKESPEEEECVTPAHSITATVESDHVIKQAANNGSAVNKDIVYRTWSQEMMDNLVKTRKAAMAKKQKLIEQGKLDVQLLDIWYEEFLVLHPDYKSTKKNLMQKFKWYRARMKKLSASGDPSAVKMSDYQVIAQSTLPGKDDIRREGSFQGASVSSEQTPLRIRNIRKDVYLHIKALMEESRIFLPMKLPQEPELKQQDSSQLPPMPQPFQGAGSVANLMSQSSLNTAGPLGILPMGGGISQPHQQPPVSFIMAQAGSSVSNNFSTPSSLNPTTAQHLQQQQLRQQHIQQQQLQQHLSASQTLAQMHQDVGRRESLSCVPNPPPLTISVTSAAPSVSSLPFQQQQQQQFRGAPDVPLNLSLPTHIKQQQDGGGAAAGGNFEDDSVTEEESGKKDTIKLPGGATLVAVTDRNADALLKPKPVEKPHVTITIGEKMKGGGDQLPNEVDLQQQQDMSMEQQHPSNLALKQQPIVLSIPKFPMRNPDLLQPQSHLQPELPQHPSLPQLKPYGMDAKKLAVLPSPLHQQLLHQQQQAPGATMGPPTIPPLPHSQPNPFAFAPKAIFIPSRVKARLDEHGMTDLQFIRLLDIYEKARDEYIDTLKRGYLAFFPYILGSHWKQQQSPAAAANSPLTGRKLALIVDLYVEEKNKGRIVTPEYLTKKPCQFVVTEQLLKQLLVTRAEVVRDMEEKSRSAGGGEVNSAIANVELCKRWVANCPEMKMTAKQLISIHEMLTYDTSKSSASPEIECTLSDVWKLMEKSVSRGGGTQDGGGGGDLKRKVQDEEDTEYDEETLSVDQLQEWLLETQGCLSKRGVVAGRPHYAVKNRRFFWTLDMLDDVQDCCLLGYAKWRAAKTRRTTSIGEFVFREWKRRYPADDRLDCREILAKYARSNRLTKRMRQRRTERTFEKWKLSCEEFSRAEDLNQVIVEDHPMEDLEEEERCPSGAALGNKANEDGDPAFSGRLTSLSKIASLQIASNVKRNFHDDEDVLGYIGEVQRLGKGNHPITWTPDVIRDLIKARQLARARKREWEAWATKKFGGIGFAYNNPEVRNVKVDDMFKEEWCKLRPEMKSLSIWTLVSYARKYDNLKKQLIIDNGQSNVKPEPTAAAASSGEGEESPEKNGDLPEKKAFHINVFFENSCVPKFDLEELERLPGVSQEMVDLLVTRQLAKIRQEEQKIPMRLTDLWGEEWHRFRPDDKASGSLLQRRLWELERIPGNVALVSPALLRATTTEKSWPAPQEDEAPRLVTRSNVFVEDPEFLRFGMELRQEIPSGRKRGRERREKWVIRYSTDVYARKKRGLVIPALEKEEGERDWDEEEEEEPQSEPIRILPKAVSTADKEDWRLRWLPSLSSQHKDKFHCNACTKEFHNINNFLHHYHLHGHDENTSQPSQIG